VCDASKTCTVRLARPEDLAAVLQVHSAPGESTPSRPTDLQSRTWARMIESDDLTTYLAEVDGMPVGTATMMTMPNLTYRCAPTAFIEAVVVATIHRRQGIATKVMGRILSDARAAGCNKVQLLSHKRHASGAHCLYTSLGFAAEAEGFRLYLREVPAAVQAAQAGGP